MRRSGYSISHQDFRAYEGLMHLPAFIILCLFYQAEVRKFLYALVSCVRFGKKCPAEELNLLFSGVTVLFYAFITAMITVLFSCFEIGACLSTLFGPKRMLAFGFGITSCLLFSLVLRPSYTSHRPLTLPKAMLLGIAQGFSLVPGVSRFGITLVGARHLGLSPSQAFSFSWIMAVPLMIGAFVKEMWDKGFSMGVLFSGSSLQVGDFFLFLIATAGAFLVFMKGYALVLNHRIVFLGIYLIIPLVLSLMI